MHISLMKYESGFNPNALLGYTLVPFHISDHFAGETAECSQVQVGPMGETQNTTNGQGGPSNRERAMGEGQP